MKIKFKWFLAELTIYILKKVLCTGIRSKFKILAILLWNWSEPLPYKQKQFLVEVTMQKHSLATVTMQKNSPESVSKWDKISSNGC